MHQQSQSLPKKSFDGLVTAYLVRLRQSQRAPDLAFLNDLIRAHLHFIPYESFSKILDSGRHIEFGGYLPPLDLSVERIVDQRMGGTCWVLARCFAALLTHVGFDASLLHMEPGHLCIRVDLESSPYYVDIAYGAPLFQAIPLNREIILRAPSETFQFQPQGGRALVIRTPGPTKTLDFSPINQFLSYPTAFSVVGRPQRTFGTPPAPFLPAALSAYLGTA